MGSHNHLPGYPHNIDQIFYPLNDEVSVAGNLQKRLNVNRMRYFKSNRNTNWGDTMCPRNSQKKALWMKRLPGIFASEYEAIVMNGERRYE